jgi:hypothetical protein
MVLTSSALFVDCAAAGRRAARATLRIGMKRLFVVDRDFFTALDVPQSEEQHVAVQSSHKGIWLAGVIDVVRAVAAARAVQTEASVDVADAQDLTIPCAPAGFEIGDSFACVLSYLLPTFEMNGSETTLPIDRRLADCEALREFHCGIVRQDIGRI